MRTGNRKEKKMANECLVAYLDGQDKREKHPLSEGVYKLRDVENNLENIIATLAIINTKHDAGLIYSKDENLGMCLAAERGGWLHTLPTDISRILGYYVMPAIRAFGGDGLSKDIVDIVAKQAELEVHVLLAKSEVLRVMMTQVKGNTATDHYAYDLAGLVESVSELVARYNPKRKKVS